MAEIEERPSKIRKLSISENSIPTDIKNPESSVNEQPNKIPGPQAEDESDDGEDNGHRKTTQDPSEERPALSKSQLKKLRKKQAWENGKEDRRIKRREKHKEKQARKAEIRASLEAKITNGELEIPPPPQTNKKIRPRRPVQTPVTFIFDCDFDELMTEKEIISLGAQITRCWSDNRCTPYRTHMVISSWKSELRKRFETVLDNNHLNWKVKFTDEDFEAAAGAMDVIMRGPGGGKLVGAFNLEDGEGKLEMPKVDGLKKKLETDQTKEKPEEEAVPLGPLEAEMPHTTTTGALTLSENTTLHPSSEVLTSNGSDPIFNPSENLHSKPSTELASLPPITSPTVTKKPKSNPVIFDQTILPPSLRSPTPALIYLTSDSPHTLSALSPNVSYIIGGIVDKNRHKGLCYKRACERGIPTAKLPIGEYMTMQSRSVLAVNHVVEIMLKWMETGDWGSAFLSVIPKRKEAKLRIKGGKKEDEDESGSRGDEEESRDGAEDSGGEDEDEDGGVELEVEGKGEMERDGSMGTG